MVQRDRGSDRVAVKYSVDDRRKRVVAKSDIDSKSKREIYDVTIAKSDDGVLCGKGAFLVGECKGKTRSKRRCPSHWVIPLSHCCFFLEHHQSRQEEANNLKVQRNGK